MLRTIKQLDPNQIQQNADAIFYGMSLMSYDTFLLIITL